MLGDDAFVSEGRGDGEACGVPGWDPASRSSLRVRDVLRSSWDSRSPRRSRTRDVRAAIVSATSARRRALCSSCLALLAVSSAFLKEAFNSSTSTRDFRESCSAASARSFHSAICFTKRAFSASASSAFFRVSSTRCAASARQRSSCAWAFCRACRADCALWRQRTGVSNPGSSSRSQSSLLQNPRNVFFIFAAQLEHPETSALARAAKAPSFALMSPILPLHWQL
mmetsp:Transcript_114326/g.160436  ORF Transcript_114326/g.160436 Transcript_114326/m.160436 type:complete len:226 (+) Transcript_114326:700-1377(+)